MAQNLKIDEPQQSPGGIGTVSRPTCKNPLCSRRAKFGCDYCSRCGPSITVPSNPDPIPNPQPTPRPKPQPSNDDLTGLERRMDRLEERLDTIIELLEEDD